MALERPDVKSTLIIIRKGEDGPYQLSGLIRQTDSSGETMIRASNQNLTSVEFDDIEFTTPPTSNVDGDISMTHYTGDRAVDLNVNV